MRGIGQMARESGLTVSALRFYDGAGVLPPARVDPHSNYRWYSDEQVVAARLIARLRRVGMPLADIGRVLEPTARTPRWSTGSSRAHLTRLEAGLADARRELSAARALLDQESPAMTRPVAIRIATTAAALHRALSTVRHAVGTDPELPMLSGVLFDAQDGAAQVVATDRYRLAVAALPGAEVGPGGRRPVAGRARRRAARRTGPDRRRPGHRRGRRRPDHRGRDRGARYAPDPRLPRLPPRPARPGGPPAARRRRCAARRPWPPPRCAPPAARAAASRRSRCSRSAPTARSASPARACCEMGLNPEFLLQALDAGGGGQLVLELDGPIAPAGHPRSRTGPATCGCSCRCG